MEFSFTNLIIAIIVLVFGVVGLLLGGMLVFNVTAAHFSRLELKSLITGVFLSVVALMIVVIIVGAVTGS